MKPQKVTPISEAELLAAVKNSLNICGTHFDTTLQLYIDEIKEYLRSAGIADGVIDSNVAIGCISRGVADSWNYGNGDTKLSEYFYQRAEQLRHYVCVYTEAKITVNAKDSETGAALDHLLLTITSATKADDGYYYLPAGDTVYTMRVQKTGYYTSRVEFSVTEEEAAAGIKIIDVALTPNT